MCLFWYSAHTMYLIHGVNRAEGEQCQFLQGDEVRPGRPGRPGQRGEGGGSAGVQWGALSAAPEAARLRSPAVVRCRTVPFGLGRRAQPSPDRAHPLGDATRRGCERRTWLPLEGHGLKAAMDAPPCPPADDLLSYTTRTWRPWGPESLSSGLSSWS